MRRIGRSRGFALASSSAAVAVIVATLALQLQSFWLFAVAASLFGINLAFTQQYRYAAAESVPAKYVPRAVSFVLLGSIGGAIVGPELATRGYDWVDKIPYAGTMLSLAVLYAVQALLFLKLEGLRRGRDTMADVSSRPVSEIARQPVFIVAVLGGVVWLWVDDAGYDGDTAEHAHQRRFSHCRKRRVSFAPTYWGCMCHRWFPDS